MAISVKDSSVWKTVENIFCKDGGVWKTVEAAFIKDGGVWKEFYSSVVSLWDDITTAVYSGDSFSIAAQESNIASFTFSPDGTKMFMVGLSTDRVYEYTLSTAFSISTASYTGNNFSVNAQDSSPSGIAFNTNGTQMFISGTFSKKVHQYTLSTAFSISTASYTGNNFSFAAQDTGPVSFVFNPAGTKMFMCGIESGTDKVYQYTLSTAFSIATASYTGKNFVSLPLSSNFIGIAFNTDGTKMFIANIGFTRVYEHVLSVPFDISTATYVSSVGVGDASGPTDIFFNTDGSKMFLLSRNNDGVYEYISA